MTREEQVEKVVEFLYEGGLMAIRSLVNDLSDAQLSYWCEGLEDVEEEDNG